MSLIATRTSTGNPNFFPIGKGFGFVLYLDNKEDVTWQKTIPHLHKNICQLLDCAGNMCC